MPKVAASMADVDTSYNPIAPGVYTAEIVSVEEKVVSESPKRIAYHVEYEIVEAQDAENEEERGRKLTNQVHIHKKSGELNEFGLAELKRHFEATLGEDGFDPANADTDEIIGHRLLIEVASTESEHKNKLTGETETRTYSNVANIAPVN